MLEGLDEVFSALALGAIPLVWLLVVARTVGLPHTVREWFPDLGSNELRAVLGAALVFAAGQLVSGLTERLGDGMKDDYATLHAFAPFFARKLFPDGEADMIVPSERRIRRALLVTDSGKRGKLGESMVVAHGGIRDDVPEALVPHDFLLSPETYCAGDLDKCMRPAAQVYYTARNSVVKQEGQREELVTLQRMIDFARSLSYEMAFLWLGTVLVACGTLLIGCIRDRRPPPDVLTAFALLGWVLTCLLSGGWAWLCLAVVAVPVGVRLSRGPSEPDPSAVVHKLLVLSAGLYVLWRLSRVAYEHYEIEYNARVFGFYFSSLLNPS